uniref:Retrovirus-related Pol polyprotein from transposon TNT 1-94-like beta-barrel domain-containing protein n=1 Tax=Cannabis sativa TaxID=3483 RepID=A0A803Q8R6_CANSA
MESSTSNPLASMAPAAPPPSPIQWNPFANSLSSSLTIKLNRINYLSWKSQVVPTVTGHGLDQILFSNITPPPNLITGAPNLEYLQWKKKDHLLLSWLRSSMSELILACVATFATSFSKRTLSIAEYVEKAKATANALAIAGFLVTTQDLVLQLFNGLGQEFDPVVSGITSRGDHLSFEEVQALLLSHETRLEHHNSVTDSSLKMQANLSMNQSRNGGNHGSGASTRTENNEIGRGNGQYFGRGTGSKLLCQVCLRFGHTTAVCHYQFDKKFVTPKGATNHISYGTTNLDTATPYHGTETLAIGNRKKLLISHIGQSSIPYIDSSPLHLNNILHVPSIKKNLVSVSQLTTDNNVYIS